MRGSCQRIENGFIQVTVTYTRTDDPGVTRVYQCFGWQIGGVSVVVNNPNFRQLGQLRYIERRGCGVLTRRRTLVVDFTVMDIPQRTIVNGFESSDIRGVSFGHVATIHNGVVHHHQHTTVGRGFVCGGYHGVIQVERAISAHTCRRTHCADQHHRLVALDGEIEEIGGFFHGIRTMCYHEAVSFITLGINLFRQR